MPCLMMWSKFIHCLYPCMRVGNQYWLTLSICCSCQFGIWWCLIRSLNLGRRCHESSLNLALLPSLTSQKLCCWIISLCCLATFQIKDPAPTFVNRIRSSISRLFAYFAIQRIAQGVCSAEIHFHQRRAPMKTLLCWGSRSPVPLELFERQTVAHFTSAHFLFCLEFPHIKVLWRCLICLSTHFGTVKTEKKI